MRNRRWTKPAVTTLVVLVVVGLGWFWWSDTGKGWRYQYRLASYCDGLIPYHESAALTGLDGDRLGVTQRSTGELGDRACLVGNVNVVIGLAPYGAENAAGGDNVFSDIRTLDQDEDGFPVPLGGGWPGYTKGQRFATVDLPCANRSYSVLVSALQLSGDLSRDYLPAMTRLVAATAVLTAHRHGCQAHPGSGAPNPQAEPVLDSAVTFPAGACAGTPSDEAQQFQWLRQSAATSSTVEETCQLGRDDATGNSDDADDPQNTLTAYYGPYAQARRTAGSADDGYDGTAAADSGSGDSWAWASASCPDHQPRSLYWVSGYKFSQAHLKKMLRGFARHSARIHGCTDLKLP